MRAPTVWWDCQVAKEAHFPHTAMQQKVGSIYRWKDNTGKV